MRGEDEHNGAGLCGHSKWRRTELSRASEQLVSKFWTFFCRKHFAAETLPRSLERGGWGGGGGKVEIRWENQKMSVRKQMRLFALEVQGKQGISREESITGSGAQWQRMTDVFPSVLTNEIPVQKLSPDGSLLNNRSFVQLKKNIAQLRRARGDRYTLFAKKQKKNE